MNAILTRQEIYPSSYVLQFETEGDEIETTPLTHDSNQLETCVSQGRLTMMLIPIMVSVVARVSCKPGWTFVMSKSVDLNRYC